MSQVLNIYTGAFPTITANSLKYVVYKQADYPAEYDSQTFAPGVSGHPIRTVTFPGLPDANYKWKLLEMNGLTVVREIGSFDVVPGASNIGYKPPIEIQVGVTTGLTATATTFQFDGTAGTYDWRGWDIYVERVGQGTMYKTVQYSWDTATGIFTLLTPGDAFGDEELFNVEFGLKTDLMAPVERREIFSDVMVVTAATTLVAGDVGKNILIKGASGSFDITLPDITTVQSNVPFYFEAGIGSHKCVKIKTVSGQIIDWLKGSRTDIKIGVCESLMLYRHNDGSTDRWRVFKADGNFRTVGRIITTDADITVQEFNCVPLDGASLSTSDYARLYEDFVQQLPPSQVCNFADWATGNNRYKYSYASGGVFKVPDRRNMYLRNTNGTDLPGVYQEDNVGSFSGSLTLPKGNSYTGAPNNTRIGNGLDSTGQDKSIPFSYTAVIAETRPKSVIVKQYVLV